MKTFIGVMFLISTTMAAAQAAPTVYIPLGTANEIAIVDAASSKVTGTITGLVNPHGLAATPDGGLLVAGSNQEQQPGQAPVPPRPEGMTEAEHLSHHQAPAAGAPGPGISQVDIVDTKSRKVIRHVPVRGAVHHTLVTPDGSFAITTNTTAGGISVIDLKSFSVVKTIATGPVPNYAVATADGSRLYVSNAGNNTISEIDTGKWIVSRNLSAGPAPEHLVLSPDGATLYVNNIGNGTVSAVQVASGETVKSYKVGKDPHGIEFSDDGKTLFVASKDENKLVAIDLDKGNQREIQLSPAPYHVTAIHGTGKLYISSRKLPEIWVVDQQSLQVQQKIKIKGEGHQMAVVK